MNRWTEEQLEELERTADPDWDSAVQYPASPDHGAVVSVLIGHRDFQTIAHCADERGETLTQFMLAAALERAGKRTDDCPSGSDS